MKRTDLFFLIFFLTPCLNAVANDTIRLSLFQPTLTVSPIDSIDFSNCQNLTDIFVTNGYHKRLKQIDLTNCILLERLYCG